MSFLTRKMLPAIALAAMLSAAQAQTGDQDHNAHHPDGAAAQTQSSPGTAPVGSPMIGQGTGSGIIVRQGAGEPDGQAGGQAPAGQPGMMMGMERMRSMMGAQDGQSGMMGMMRSMMMDRQGGGQQGTMGLPFEHIEGRIAFLKTELKITDAQGPQWNAFTDALRANAKAHQAMRDQMMKGGMPDAWPDRLAAQQRMLAMRLDGLKSIEAAAKPLYAVLTGEQKALADQLLAGPMGMM